MSLINLIAIAAGAWASWRRRQHAYDELMALDDRLLADVGIRRTDIPSMFHEKVRREAAGGQGAAMVLSALQAKLVFGHRGLPPIWPQL